MTDPVAKKVKPVPLGAVVVRGVPVPKAVPQQTLNPTPDIVPRKPPHWEPPHISVAATDVLYVTAEKDTAPLHVEDGLLPHPDAQPIDNNDRWKVTIGFDNGADAHRFYDAVSDHVMPLVAAKTEPVVDDAGKPVVDAAGKPKVKVVAAA